MFCLYHNELGRDFEGSEFGILPDERTELMSSAFEVVFRELLNITNLVDLFAGRINRELFLRVVD
jgi:hypothetical protein